MRLRSIAQVVIVNIVATICLLEIGLRVQQSVGPLYDLHLNPETLMINLSAELNHVPEPGEYWDRDGFRKMEEPNSPYCVRKILFMGDSFMQGTQKASNGEIIASRPSDTIPVNIRQFFREKLREELCVFNAGYASYSPSIFVPQAKKLIPLVKPDIVVIDVDETDLWDDYYRYRELVTRDANGSIVVVRPTPINVQFHQGLLSSTSKALYLHRLFSKLYFTRIEFPKTVERNNQSRPADNLALSKIPAAEERAKHGLEIEYFKRTLEDLTQTVVSLMGTPDSLIYIHHPHLEHLNTAGAVFNNVQLEVVRGVASRNNVRFYDATAALKFEFGMKPQNYYIENDMHFNSAGTRAYGISVAKYLAEEFRKN